VRRSGRVGEHHCWRGDVGDRREQIVSELADVANYAFMIAEHLGVDLRAEMIQKLKEVEQRPSWKGKAA
jgi:NTP pyrophosphatase (non-canonical NTP hydrolase)